MSESSDEEVVKKSQSATDKSRKRLRLLSETSSTKSPEVIELTNGSSDDSDEGPDELITSATEHRNGRARLEAEDDEEPDGDDDEEDSDAADREEDAIIEELYEDEDDTIAQSSATQKRIKGLRDNVTHFFQTASEVDLASIPGVSRKKVEQLLMLRPFESWDDLNEKIHHHKSAGINEDVVINAVKTIKSRNIVDKLMNDCLKLATDIGNLVERLPAANQPKCIPSNLKLAPYQLIGLNWMILLHNRGINGILADEMGLGKTIQVIAFLAWLRERGMVRHHLVIVPSSTLDNWEREFDTWCPEIRLLQYYGSQDQRAQIRYYIARHPEEVDVVLTTYNIAQNPEDRKLFKRIPFEYLIFDEAHMLKNMKSCRYQGLIKIRSKRRILLTGTPVQNNLVELMSLLVFTMPRMFASKMAHVEAIFSAASREEGGKTQFERERIEQARKIMKPFVLRRLKENVLKDLPKKSEKVIRCPMTKSQKKLYEGLVDSFKREITDDPQAVLDNDNSFQEVEIQDAVPGSDVDTEHRGSSMLMSMRKAANHPLLLRTHYTKEKLAKMAELILKEPTHVDCNKDLVLEDMSVMHDYELHQLCKNIKSIQKFKLSDDVIVDSAKFMFLDGLLNELKEKKERCLLFSQFTMMLDIMEEYLTIRNFQFTRLDGKTKVSDRIGLIDKFVQDDEIQVFLLSTRAGGLGINLTAASTVVIHDIDFNPYNDKQAEDRSHRMGQRKDVTVYKLICERTVEEGMLDITQEKLRLGKDMSEAPDMEKGAPQTKDLRSLLRNSLKV